MSVLIADFLKYVRPEVPGCPEPMITDAVQRACIDFCTRTELLSEIVELTTVAGTVDYIVAPTDTLLYPARLRNVILDELPLEKTEAASYATLTERFTSASPTHYFAPTRNQLTLAPNPATAEVLELDVVLRPKRTAETVPDVLFEEWVSAIASGAKAQLLVMEGQPWANPALGAFHQALYMDEVHNAAVNAATGNTGAAMHVEPSPI